ncbi:MAG TPA: MlaD family protein [Acetobacteraceae bacterium]|nr:MlaD family protein [Acetobacteraceae bacterium]
MNDAPLPHAIEHHSRWPGWIWAVPIAAAAIVGYLAFQQFAERGPEVTVIFPTGDGIKAGTTKVQFEGIAVGEVEAVRFEKDMRHVDAVLRLHRDLEGHLGKGTRFWIAGKPNISDLSSLKSVIAGPHIGMQPMPGLRQDHYDGLAEQPPDADHTHVTHFVLRSDKLGTISRGSPIYYRDLKVGVVARSQLESDGRHFRIDAFIDAPFDRLVHADTRFWDASAVQVAMAGSGPRLQFQSVPALLEGAVDFETPEGPVAGPQAQPNTIFKLYSSRGAAEQAPDDRAVTYRVVFHAEEAGALDAGASVELDAKRIGSVTQSQLKYDPGSGTLNDLVTLAVEPSSIALAGATWAANARPQMDAMLRRLIQQGLRARLGSSIPLVGGKVVELAFLPNATPATLGSGAVPEIPTGPASGLGGIMASLNAVVAKLDAMPLDQIGDNVHDVTQRLAALSKSPQTQQSLAHLDEALANLKEVTRDARTQVGPLLTDLRHVAVEAQTTVASLQELVSRNDLAASTPGTAGLGGTLYELSRAARSLRELADYLDQHPEALIRGKGDAG